MSGGGAAEEEAEDGVSEEGREKAGAEHATLRWESCCGRSRRR